MRKLLLVMFIAIAVVGQIFGQSKEIIEKIKKNDLAVLKNPNSTRPTIWLDRTLYHLLLTEELMCANDPEYRTLNRSSAYPVLSDSTLQLIISNANEAILARTKAYNLLSNHFYRRIENKKYWKIGYSNENVLQEVVWVVIREKNIICLSIF